MLTVFLSPSGRRRGKKSRKKKKKKKKKKLKKLKQTGATAPTEEGIGLRWRHGVVARFACSIGSSSSSPN